MGIHSDWLRDIQQWRKTEPNSEHLNGDSESNSRRDRRSHGSSNKFLRRIKSLQPIGIHHINAWRRISIYPDIFWARPDKSNNNSKNNRSRKHNRYNKHLYAIATCSSLLFPNVALAQGVGGVSATANPIANSSGSVTNQAIQVLQGPYITNTYGGGVSCQGSTFNLTPYVQFADSRKDPWEDFYLEPQYDMTDFTGKVTEVVTTVKNYPWEDWYDTRVRTDPNDPLYDVDGDGNPDRWWEDGASMDITVEVDGPDGIPDNPGSQIWQKPVRTDMKANQNFNLGLSATLSLPLNRKFQRQCHEAAQAQNDMQVQLVANKRLDFELARLKNCGDLKQKGIMFHPMSPYASICADVIVTQARPGSLPDHTHQLGTPPPPKEEVTSSDSVPSSESVSPDSDLSAVPSVPEQIKQGQFFPSLSLPWQKSSSQEALSPSGEGPLGVWQVGQMKSPQQQSSQSSSQSED
jgi:hypothetical protein